MATLPKFSVFAQHNAYNNPAYMDEIEHATYLLARLEQDACWLLSYLHRMHERYTPSGLGIPQDTCDQVADIATHILDRLQKIDSATLAETERRAAHQEQDDAWWIRVAYTSEHNNPLR